MVTGRLPQTPLVCTEDVDLTGNTNYSPNSVESVKSATQTFTFKKLDLLR